MPDPKENKEKFGNKLSKFFKNKKNEAKIKLGMTGPGHRLGDTSSQQSSSSSGSGRRGSPAPVAKRAETSSEAKQAGAAALARFEKKDTGSVFGTSLASIRAQARREMEAEQAAAAAGVAVEEPKSPQSPKQDPERLAVSGIYFACPLIGPEILTKDEWNKKIREFLYEQLEHERALTATLMIHTLTKNKEKVEQCVKTIHRMFDNIINNPGEEKYRKVKIESRAFQDKIKEVEGGLELLLAAGFEEKDIETAPGQTEKFLVFPEEKLGDIEQLTLLCDALDSAEPISLELDRGLQVLLPSQASKRQELPPAFFRLTAEELRKEYQLRAEAMERSQILRTKAMRERDEQREMKVYKYAIIRVRFPDGTLLQGTFNVYEKLETVLAFVRENLSFGDEEEPRPYVLTTPTGQKLVEGGPESGNMLLDLKLVPATILNFAWSKPCAPGTEEAFLKQEILALMSEI
ncbi:UBX domain-containing protein 6 [Neocloeon triangulifer]|uniref:UBX domain-containing protein 6 n=1 Tax=Neocloeon triangulifer TaxID=2078957 RepID=UPI00286F117D|nr:UBX domain-containing protein 6 [Neocloeon triangulifer]